MVRELLRAEDLILEREGTGQLHHMDFSVAAGKSAGLIGLSGGGKTVLAKILCGELEPDKGVILGEGQPLRREQLARLSLRISGESRLIENLSVQEYLLVLGRPRKERGLLIPRRRIRSACLELLAGFELEPWLDMPVAQIPLPVQHRLLLVGAAVRGKRLVVLDHVSDTYGLREQELLGECIRRLCQRGISVLYLSGHLDQVLWQLDHITVVRDGRRVKELYRGAFTEAALRTYMYGYRSPSEERRESREDRETAFLMDGIPVPERGLLPVHDADGSVGEFLTRLSRQSGRAVTALTADSLTERWIGEMSVLDNLMLPVSRRLSGPGFHVRGSVRRLIRSECMEQTGLSYEQMEQPFAWLNRMERFRLLRYHVMINRPDICVLDRITAGADLQDREEMRRLSADMPGILFYISGDYRELEAFKTQIYALDQGCLRKETPL